VAVPVPPSIEITLFWEPLAAAKLARAGGGWRTTEAERHCDPQPTDAPADDRDRLYFAS
jgi:hypothetical protein